MDNAEIVKWTNILTKGISGPNHATAHERLRSYLITMETNYPSPAPAMAAFFDWANDKLSKTTDTKATQTPLHCRQESGEGRVKSKPWWA